MDLVYTKPTEPKIIDDISKDSVAYIEVKKEDEETLLK